MAQEHASGPRHEPNQVGTAAIVGSGAGLVVAAVIIHAALWGYLRRLENDRPFVPPPLGPARMEGALRTEPPLQGTPQYQRWGPPEVADLRRAEQAVLDSYGWVDRDRGIARVPIRRAMQLYVSRGQP